MARKTLAEVIEYLERLFEQFPEERHRKYGKEYSKLLNFQRERPNLDLGIGFVAPASWQLVHAYPKLDELIADYHCTQLKQKVIMWVQTTADPFWQDQYEKWGSPTATELSLYQFMLLKQRMELEEQRERIVSG